jgi:hypothetical protein
MSNRNDDDNSDEEYVDVDEKIMGNAKEYCQLQLNNEELTVASLGYYSRIPDVVIEKDFGIDKRFTIYNLVHTRETINEKQKEKEGIPIMKLVDKANEKEWFCIAVKLFDNHGNNAFEVGFMFVRNGQTAHAIQLEKNVNAENIIPILLENVIDMGVKIV